MVGKSVVARDCRAQNLVDHWPVVTYVRLPCKKESWKHHNDSILKGWRPKTENDEAGFGRLIVESLEDAQDLLGEVSIEDITKKLTLNQQEEETRWSERRQNILKLKKLERKRG